MKQAIWNRGLALCAVLCAAIGSAFANEEPTVTIISAAMRTGTTVMDVVYRVDDPDDATVKVRVLAFVDGVRSFANVIRPETWAEGTEGNLGDTITTGVEHTLSWDVASDWNIDLGQIKFEVLCQDDRGLLPFDWLTIPATEGKPEVTISEHSPSDSDVLDAFFWQYSDSDAGLMLTNNTLVGSQSNNEFVNVKFVSGDEIQAYGIPYICRTMNLDVATREEVALANDATRGLYDIGKWYISPRTNDGINIVLGWGSDAHGRTSGPWGCADIEEIAAGGSHNLALTDGGSVCAWGNCLGGGCNVPVGLASNAVAIAAGSSHSMALKYDGTVEVWGGNLYGQCDVPIGVSNVVAIAAGGNHCLALSGNGTVIAWGSNDSGACNVPFDLTDVVAIAAGSFHHSLALKNDGTVVAWGDNTLGKCDVPVGLTNVVAVGAGFGHSLALRNDGAVVAWGNNSYGECDVPENLTNAVSIAVSFLHNLSLTSDGRLVAWGGNSSGQSDVPSGLANVTRIAAGDNHSLVLRPKVQE